MFILLFTLLSNTGDLNWTYDIVLLLESVIFFLTKDFTLYYAKKKS